MQQDLSENTVTAWLFASVPGFSNSPEARGLDEEEREDPLCVGRALASYAVRLVKSARGGPWRGSTREAQLAELFESLEALAGNADSGVQNFLQVYIFEAIEEEEKVMEEFARHLGPKARELWGEVFFLGYE